VALTLLSTIFGKEMNFKRSISFCILFAMLGMLACPIVEAASVRKQDMRCHDQAPAPRNARPMSCCGQDAIPVQDSHAQVNLMAFSHLHPAMTGAILEISFAPDFDPLYRKTGEHLATLSVLRL
jgi:hypothetical protein